eukprot:m.165655 g.165655  ORF g.165655 m.165655 type:complete len:55 (-) comp24980_c1_seq1:281-445(-)
MDSAWGLSVPILNQGAELNTVVAGISLLSLFTAMYSPPHCCPGLVAGLGAVGGG